MTKTPALATEPAAEPAPVVEEAPKPATVKKPKMKPKSGPTGAWKTSIRDNDVASHSVQFRKFIDILLFQLHFFHLAAFLANCAVIVGQPAPSRWKEASLEPRFHESHLVRKTKPNRQRLRLLELWVR